jgi:Tol biopolymer transport system component/DNA-binding winged helix-turn-helix (wHTH) protein
VGVRTVKASSKRSSSVRFGQFELNLSEERLFKKRFPVRLENQPLQILSALVDHPGEMVSREELCALLWPDGTYVDFDEGLNTAIKKLRYALGDSAESPVFIETVPRRGYRFIAPVAHNGEGSALESVSPTADAGNDELNYGDGNGGRAVASFPANRRPVGSPTSEARDGKSLWRLALVVGVAVAVALGVGYAVRSKMSRNRRPSLDKFQVTKLTDSGRVELAAISADGRYVCYARRDHGLSGLWLYQVATHSEVQILPADAVGFEGLTFSPDGNHIYYVRADTNDPGFKYLYVMPLLGGSNRLLIKDIDSPIGFSPDGQRFVYTRGVPPRNSTDVRIANADGSGDRLLSTIQNTYPGFQPGPTWSPDGRTVAVSLRLYGGRHSYILNAVSVADGSARELFSSANALGRPLWLPEGDTLLLVMNDQNDRGQLWTISYPNAEVRRVTNDLTDYDTRADLTGDAKTLVAIANHPISNLWAAPAADLSLAQQINSAALPLFRVVEAQDGHLLATSMDGKLWSLRPDGSQRTLFTDLLVTDFQGDPTPCGRFIVFASGRAATTELVRVAANGSDPVRLVKGDLNSAVCTPDGKYIFYDDTHTIFRIPVEGGTSREIAKVLGENIGGRLSISPDGKFLAYPYRDSVPIPATKLAIIPAEGGSPTIVLNAPGVVWGLLWSPDGKSLQYSFPKNGIYNILNQPITGGEPRQLTKFDSGIIYDFHWSLDGKRLLMARGEATSDAALLSNLR